MKAKSVVGLLVAGAAVAAGVYFAVGREDDSAVVQETAAVRRGTLVEIASLSGKVKADVQVEVKSRASGEVTEVAVEVGDQVAPGDLLFKLDPIDEQRAVATARAALSSARASLAQAQASLSVARTETKEAEAKLAVREQAAAEGLVSKEELRTVQNAAESARQTIALRSADVQAARAQLQRSKLDLEEAERRLSETTIRAPIAGTVLSVGAEQGTIVASGITNIAGGTALMTLGDLSTLYVVGALDEADVGRVHVGDAVTIHVDAFGDRTFDGKVERISPLGVEESNVVTFDVDVLVTDKDGGLLRPGMNADLEVVTDRHENALLVPVLAIRSENKQRYVLLDDGKKPPVKMLGTDGTLAAVEGDLHEGDKVVTSEPASTASPKRPGMFGPPKKK